MFYLFADSLSSTHSRQDGVAVTSSADESLDTGDNMATGGTSLARPRFHLDQTTTSDDDSEFTVSVHHDECHHDNHDVAMETVSETPLTDDDSPDRSYFM